MAALEGPIRFGIVGCADIARKVSRAIALAPNAEVCAVASRSADKAAAFAAANAPFVPPEAKIYGSYEALLDDPDLDAVYMPLPTSLHLRWALLAARRRKHILLEKPVALHAAEFDAIAAACDSAGVQIMDGTMWIHNPRTAAIRDFLSDAQLFGSLNTVHACFTFPADDDFLKNDIRVKPDLDAHGALGDAGWYCIRAILFVANFELPKTAIALPGAVRNEAGVILSCGASLHWEDGKSATFHCSFLSNLTMDITAIGTQGTLHVNDFIIPFQEHEAHFSTGTRSAFNELVTAWDPKPSKHIVSVDLPQEACMVREFSNLVASIKKGSKPEKYWPTISKKTQLVLDAVKASVESGFKPVEIGSYIALSNPLIGQNLVFVSRKLACHSVFLNSLAFLVASLVGLCCGGCYQT